MRTLSRFLVRPRAPEITPEAREVLRRRLSMPELCILTELGQLRVALTRFAGA